MKGRYYRFLKPFSKLVELTPEEKKLKEEGRLEIPEKELLAQKEQAMKEQLLKEIQETPEVEAAEYYTGDDGNLRILICMEDSLYPTVMAKLVSLCSRVANNQEMSFSGFLLEDGAKDLW